MRKKIWPGHVACTGNEINTHRILVGEPRTMKPPLRNTSRLEDNIKMDVKWNWRVCTEFIWLRVGTIGELL